MKINFNVPVIDLDGKILKDDTGKDLNVRVVVSNLLCQAPGMADAAKIFDLAITIRKSENPVELTTEEVKYIRTQLLTGKLITLVVGQIISLIDHAGEINLVGTKILEGANGKQN